MIQMQGCKHLPRGMEKPQLRQTPVQKLVQLTQKHVYKTCILLRFYAFQLRKMTIGYRVALGSGYNA